MANLKQSSGRDLRLTRRSLLRSAIREMRAQPRSFWYLFKALLVQLAARKRINRANQNPELIFTPSKPDIKRTREAFIEKFTARRVSLLCATNRPENLASLLSNITNQSYPNLEIVLIMHSDKFDPSQVKKRLEKTRLPHVFKVVPPSQSFGRALNTGLDLAGGYYITKFDDDDDYGKNHIWDLVQALEQSQAQLVGKWGHFVYLKSSEKVVDFGLSHRNQFVHHLSGGTILGRTDYLQTIRFDEADRAIDSRLCTKVLKTGGLLYSTHPYNYVRVRGEGHTYQRDDSSFIASSETSARRGYVLRDYEV